MPRTDTSQATHEAPYRGIKVLDLGQGVASPYCAMLLAVYGADVIKVEPPDGDWSRRLGTTYGRHSTLSAVYNRGKRSLCLDLKKPDAVDVVKRLAAESDVLIEGFRPGVMERLGLGYDALSRANPSLIYLSISGFGQTGSNAQRPCSDSVAQAFSGLVSVNVGADGVPHKVAATISDVATGVYAFQAIATALFARASVGTGRRLDVSLTQSTSALLGHKLAEHILEGGAPRALNVPAGSYQTKDGWLMLTLVNEGQYQRLCSVLGREDLARDPRFVDFARRADAADMLIPQIAEAIRTDTTAAWLSKLHAADVVSDRILDFSDWLQHPHVEETKAAIASETRGVGTVYTARTPGSFGSTEDALSPAPDVGEGGRAVLQDAGFTPATIDALVASGAMRFSDTSQVRA